ncbi:MAG: hypothetical protein R6U50_03870 [Desulfobacterales bacterium]
MAIRKHIIILVSSLFLIAGAFIGCQDQEEEFGMAEPEVGEQGTVQEQEDWDVAEPMERQDQMAGQEQDQMGQQDQTGEMAQQEEAFGEMDQAQQPGQVQAADDLIGMQVTTREGQLLGSISEVHPTGQDSGYVFIQGEGEALHAVPSNLLEMDQQGQLMASFDQSTFQESPRFTQEELQQLSDEQLQEVRGYYENMTEE